MLTRFFHRLTRLQLNKFAVTSLEYGMIVMLVMVASLGAVSSMGTHVSIPLVQVASAK
jgi:hypothetical protein